VCRTYFSFASRSASGRAFHAVIRELVLLPRNTARNVLFALMRFSFLYVLRLKQKLDCIDADDRCWRRRSLRPPLALASMKAPGEPPACVVTLRLIEGMRVTLSPTWNLCDGIAGSLSGRANPRLDGLECE
jgi:hypothetical protein